MADSNFETADSEEILLKEQIRSIRSEEPMSLERPPDPTAGSSQLKKFVVVVVDVDDVDLVWGQS